MTHSVLQTSHNGCASIRVLYLGRGLALLVLPVLLAVGVLLVARLVARAFDEGHVVVVRAGGPCQDAHEVTVVAQVLQQAGHPPSWSRGRAEIRCVFM